MPHSSSQSVRAAFLEFFRERGHEIVKSSSLVTSNDPTILFVNAGMVQFKDVFTGREQRPYRRAASSQKCIRISGKHNDLEAVGPSPRHQTFFEMLGNFSFGDYFKEDAIKFAWDFLMNVLELPRERLICTYFRGEDGIPEDTEARDIWRRVTGFGDDQIRGLGMSDNFWQMGDTGPCGPSSEIYFCNGPIDLSSFGAEQTPEGLGWVEIWNIVFMQFERSVKDGVARLEPLPAPSVDTGAGLERLTSVVAGQLSNYDTDVLRNLCERAAALAGKPYGGTRAPDDVSVRVIADHARTTAFLIAEGISPDRTGREYVLRRVMRRAIRHGHRLGIQKPFLHEVAGAVVDLMGDQYPELRERRELIASITLAEEERFRQTIERGLGLLEERFDAMKAAGLSVLDGRDAFQLYDTFGFPLDLTEVICAERGFTVDSAGYEAALGEARERSEFKGVDLATEPVYAEVQSALHNGVRFVGYDRDSAKGRIVALIAGNRQVEALAAGAEGEVITDLTPFYGEAGGQAGDRGLVQSAAGQFSVEDTQKPRTGLFVHRGRVTNGALHVGDEVELAVDVPRRERTRRNHSATHLLHWALRQVLGPQAQQKGSLVGPERLRFDFTHSRPMTPEELARVEELVNERTLKNTPVRTEVLTMDEARARGAMMIFEEKYGEVVRMLTMAESTELCGGTHARATGDIGLFKIVSEQGVAAGVRRIIAVTGEGALTHLREVEALLSEVARSAKTTPPALLDRVQKLVLHERALEKQVAELEKKLATGGGSGGVDSILAQARDVSGVKVLGVRSAVTDRGALRELAEQLRDKLGDSVVLVGSEADGKAQLVLTVSKSLVGRYRAGDLIRGIAEIVGGTGGGRPDMAQAGGTEVGRLDEAIEAVYAGVAG